MCGRGFPDGVPQILTFSRESWMQSSSFTVYWRTTWNRLSIMCFPTNINSNKTMIQNTQSIEQKITTGANTIELVWNELKHFLRTTFKPTTKEELIAGITEFWETRMTPEKCQHYIDHLQKLLWCPWGSSEKDELLVIEQSSLFITLIKRLL